MDGPGPGRERCERPGQERPGRGGSAVSEPGSGGPPGIADRVRSRVQGAGPRSEAVRCTFVASGLTELKARTFRLLTRRPEWKGSLSTVAGTTRGGERRVPAGPGGPVVRLDSVVRVFPCGQQKESCVSRILSSVEKDGLLNRREERVSTADAEKKLSPQPGSLWENAQPVRRRPC